MRFDIYVGRILYKSTLSVDEAFETFKLWTTTGLDVRMKFVQVRAKAA